MRIRSKIIISDKFLFYSIYCFHVIANIMLWDSSLGIRFPITGTLLTLCNYITIMLLMSFICFHIISRFCFHLNSFRWVLLLTGYLIASAMVLLSIRSSRFLILVLCIIVPLFYEFDIKKLIKFDLQLKIVLLVLIIGKHF